MESANQFFKNKIRQSRFLRENYSRFKRLKHRFLVPKMDLNREYLRIMNEKRDFRLYLNPEEVRIAGIEINKNCNINCLMCNTQLSTRKNKNMDLGLFENVVQHMVRLGNYRGIVLHTIGEPTMNPLLEEYLKILRRYGATVYLSTNALFLKKKLDILCRYADVVEFLRFSIDGATRETYEKIRKGAMFANLIENLEHFKKINRKNKYFKNVGVNSIASKDVQKELAYHIQFYGQHVPLERVSISLVNGLSLDHSYFFSQSILPKHIVHRKPCSALNNSSLHVLNNGDVTSCARDYNAELVFGNVAQTAPEKMINSDAIVALRKQHLENKIDPKILCAECYWVDPRVSSLFGLFQHALIRKYKKNWNVEKMQQRFDDFFDAFCEEIPDLNSFLRLVQ